MWRTRLALAVTALTIAATLTATAGTAGAAQRVGLRVLLLGATGSEPSYQAWHAQLRREGVPFDALVAGPGHAPITDATLSGTAPDGTLEARYQAVILATGGLLTCDASPCTSALSAEEWAALARFERTFHVRRLTAYAFPGPDYGLDAPAFSGVLDGQTANLTASGLQAFPYLNGPVTMAVGTYGYQARPAAAARFDTLLAGPNGTAMVGVVTHPDGREEMVQTFDGNQHQLHAWLLRHGQLAWVTRGVYLGEQRNYLELQIDDVFLPDDSWDVARRATDYDPAAAIRMTAADVTRAVAWQNATGLRMDMVYNGGGSEAHADANGGVDPLLNALLPVKDQFNWINHTWDHPNLDCSTRAFIAAQIADNTAWAQSVGLPVDGRELVTGEHSGLANLVPGNPGTIDPPSIDEAAPLGGGSLAAGSYEYAVTGWTTHGETVGSTATVAIAAAGGATELAWDAICHATRYRVYRRPAPAGAWSLVAELPHPGNAFTDAGPVAVGFVDAGGALGAAAPPAGNTARVDPYAQNPGFVGALQDTGVTVIGSDASKPYPQTPTSLGGPRWPAGTSYVDGGVRAVPRYPTNVYYNVATQAQLLSEYNHLYLPPALGGVCVDTAVTTCESAPVTWATLMAREADRIFGHVMGNDPRPHYFHQSNIAQTSLAGGGVLYPVLDAMLASYRRYFASNAPIVQLRHLAIADLLARQEAWASAAGGQVSGWIEGSQVTLLNGGGSVQVPLSGTEVGDLYGGIRSGWTTAGSGTSVHTAAINWPGTVTPLPPVTPPAPPPAPPQTRPVGHVPAPSAPRPPAAVKPPRDGPSANAGRDGSGRRGARARRARRARRRLARCAKKRRVVRNAQGRRRVVKVRRGCRPRARRVAGAKPRRPVAQQRRGA